LLTREPGTRKGADRGPTVAVRQRSRYGACPYTDPDPHCVFDGDGRRPDGRHATAHRAAEHAKSRKPAVVRGRGDLRCSAAHRAARRDRPGRTTGNPRERRCPSLDDRQHERPGSRNPATAASGAPAVARPAPSASALAAPAPDAPAVVAPVPGAPAVGQPAPVLAPAAPLVVPAATVTYAPQVTYLPAAPAVTPTPVPGPGSPSTSVPSFSAPPPAVVTRRPAAPPPVTSSGS